MVNGNPRRIDALLANQIGLRVCRARGGEFFAGFLIAGGISDESQLCIGVTLKAKCDFIQACFRFVVHSDWTAEIPVEMNRAKIASRRFGRDGWSCDGD